MLETISGTDSEISAVECKFVIHVSTKHLNVEDVHVVKERVHYKDGTSKPNLRIIRGFQRPFYVTKKAFRNHTQKKEWEDIDKLNKFSCTQDELRDQVAKALEKQYSRASYQELASSPYLYGADLPSTALLKRMYRENYPDALSPHTVMSLDIETDVSVADDPLDPRSEVTMCVVCGEDELLLTVQRSFMGKILNPAEHIKQKINKYLAEYVKNLKVSVVIVDSELDVIKDSFKKVHEKQPDFLDIWNMNFDIPKILSVLNKYDVDPRDVLCDPSIPKKLRECNYLPGKTQKVAASGKTFSIPPASQWHTLKLTASFYVIDGMCTYKQIRLGAQEEPSYRLDAILNKVLGVRKLRFTEADSYSGLAWHKYMQAEYKGEYGAYCAFDGISLLELDKKINDLRLTLPMFAGDSDFSVFNSQSRKNMVKTGAFVEEFGKIIGTVGRADDRPVSKVLSRRHWIVTLPMYLTTEDAGLQCILEDPDMYTNFRGFASDVDMISSYPTGTEVLNISKSTTIDEIIDIEGVPEYTFRMANINLMSGPVNSLEYCQTMLNLPKHEELLRLFINR